MLSTARVQSRGQITLPQEVREAMDAVPGDLIAFDVAESGVVSVRKLPRLSFAELRERFRIDDDVDVDAILAHADEFAPDEELSVT